MLQDTQPETSLRIGLQRNSAVCQSIEWDTCDCNAIESNPDKLQSNNKPRMGVMGLCRTFPDVCWLERFDDTWQDHSDIWLFISGTTWPQTTRISFLCRDLAARNPPKLIWCDLKLSLKHSRWRWTIYYSSHMSWSLLGRHGSGKSQGTPWHP